MNGQFGAHHSIYEIRTVYLQTGTLFVLNLICCFISPLLLSEGFSADLQLALLFVLSIACILRRLSLLLAPLFGLN